MSRTEKDELTRYTTHAGGAALGARLRRLSERIDRDVTQLYADLGVKFEQRWYGTLNLLSSFGPLTVGELAEALEIRHVSVSQTRDSLQRAGLIDVEADPEDGRRHKLLLSKRGRQLAERLRPLWNALAESAAALDKEAGGVVQLLDRLERALDRVSVAERAKQHIKKS
jgi:DNA-binding MarR family transcriptional regulator